MSYFCVRLQLHKATTSTYDLVHEAMANAGFTKTIVSGDGLTYELPWGEYRYSHSLLTAQSVLTRVNAAVNPIWAHNSVIVTQEVTSFWSGLAVRKLKLGRLAG